MTGVRHLLSVLLAVAAILSASGWSSGSPACPIETAHQTAMTMPGHHHHMTSRPAPASTDPRLDCAACLAVLGSLPSVEPHEFLPFVPFAQAFQPLSGIDPALDPAPPRA